MISIYKTSELHRLTKADYHHEGCWISVVSPTPQEVEELVNTYGLDADFLKSALDEEETSRVEKEDDQTLIIVDTPESEDQGDGTVIYYTSPLAIIIKDKMVFTITARENTVINDFIKGRVRGVSTAYRTKFVLLLMLRASAIYLSYLRQIEKESNALEQNLHGATKNEEIIQLLDLEKSLVYLSTSLKSNETTLNKILRGRVIKLYEDDQDLLEDVLIENKQALEMSSIYSSILAGMMEAFSSVINNNLNVVMWKLTVITVVLAVPTIVYSFYGMNTSQLPYPVTWFPTLVSFIAMVIVAVVLIKSNPMKKPAPRKKKARKKEDTQEEEI
jgi:magnesium transporter